MYPVEIPKIWADAAGKGEDIMSLIRAWVALRQQTKATPGSVGRLELERQSDAMARRINLRIKEVAG